MRSVVYNGKSTLELADAADDAVRGINHLTRCADALRYPAEPYRVLGSLTSLADRLPQTLDQIRRLLDRWHEAGEVAIDGGEFHDNPGAAITAASTHLLQRAIPAADQLAHALARAQSAIAWAGYVGPDPDGIVSLPPGRNRN